MNSIYKLLLGLGVLFFASNCTELTEEPVSRPATSTFINSPKDVVTALRGAYASFTSNEGHGKDFMTMLTLLGDRGDIGNQGTNPNRVRLNNFDHGPTNSLVIATWQQTYYAIGAANFAITAANSINYEDEALRQEHIAEARMVRAWLYFHLVRLYGDVPYVDETTPSETLKDMARTSKEVVYAAIKADCDFGIKHLPDVRDGGLKSRVTKAAAYALGADVHLSDYENPDYTKALAYAKNVIDNQAAYGLSLMPLYEDVFNADLGDHQEHIWTVDFLGGISYERWGGSYGKPVNDDQWVSITGVRNNGTVPQQWLGYGVATVNETILAKSDMTDFRNKSNILTEFIGTDGEVSHYSQWRDQVPHVAKWQRNIGGSAGTVKWPQNLTDHNYPVYRLGGVYLLAAEAAVKLGQNGLATQYINALRARARNADGVPSDFPADLAGNATMQDVRDERGVEMLFEFRRWYDIKRWANQDGVSITTYFDDITDYEGVKPSIKDWHEFLPIPQKEIDKNSKLVQNDGYL